MDQERRIRFLIPPLFFIASLVWGLARDGDTGLQNVIGLEFQTMTTQQVLGLVAGGGVAVVALGFFFGTITVFLLRIAFGLRGRYYEVVLPDDALERVWDRLGVSAEKRTKQNELFAGATFDHEILKKKSEGIHSWMMRRWSTFNISAISTIALTTSLLAGLFFDIAMNVEWVLPALLTIGLLVWSAFVAWRDTMRMAEFQAHRLRGRCLPLRPAAPTSCDSRQEDTRQRGSCV